MSDNRKGTKKKYPRFKSKNLKLKKVIGEMIYTDEWMQDFMEKNDLTIEDINNAGYFLNGEGSLWDSTQPMK